MKELSYPSEKTYYICHFNDRICNWGSIESNQTLTTGHPNLFSTANYDEWVAELQQNFHVVLGYRFDTEEQALEVHARIEELHGENSASVERAGFNIPEFWYIAGEFEIDNESSLFQVFPD